MIVTEKRLAEPNPFAKYTLSGNVLSPGSPNRGSKVKWTLKGDIPLEDIMYPSLHLSNDSFGLSSPIAISPIKTTSSLASKMKKGPKIKHGKKISNFGGFNDGPKYEEISEKDYDPMNGFQWKVSVEENAISLPDVLPDEKLSPNEKIIKDMDNIGEIFLRNRLKRHQQRRIQNEKEEKKLLLSKKNNLLINAESHLTNIITNERLHIAVERLKEDIIEEDVANEEANTLNDHDVGDGDGDIHSGLRCDEHSYTINETPDDLYYNLNDIHNNMIKAENSIFIDSKGNTRSKLSQNRKLKSSEGKKDVNHNHNHNQSQIGDQAADNELYNRQKAALKSIKNSKDNSELEDALLFYRIHNEFHTNDNDDNSINNNHDNEYDIMKKYKKNIFNHLSNDRLKTTTTGSHLRRGMKQTLATYYDIDYNHQMKQFNENIKEPPLSSSYSEINHNHYHNRNNHTNTNTNTNTNTKIDFSPVHESPSHSKRIAQDILLINQFKNKILPEMFIKPYHSLGSGSGSGSMKDAISNEKMRSNLNKKEIKKLNNNIKKFKDNDYVINMKNYGVGDLQGLCLGQSIKEFSSLSKLILKENRLTYKSIPTIFNNLHCDKVSVV
jgi:hypothetical protein